MTLLLAKILGGLVILLAIIGFSYYEGHHQEELVFTTYKTTQAAVAEKEASDSAAKALKLQQDYDAALATIQADAQKEITQNAQDKDATISQLRAGTISLSNELASTRKANLSKPGTAATRALIASSSQLPDDTAEFLVSESNRADDITIKYNAAVKLLQQDRLTCNSSTQ